MACGAAYEFKQKKNMRLEKSVRSEEDNLMLYNKWFQDVISFQASGNVYLVIAINVYIV